MMRDTTFRELSRAETIDGVSAEFVMDEDTFRGFYERTARGLWAYLVRVTGDRALADDLLQETYYRFLRAAATHENEQHRRNSLFRIATNLLRDERRRNTARENSNTGGIEMEQLPSGADAGTAEQMADFTRAMSTLKPRERAMLWLAYAEGASHAEIASALGLRPKSLKGLLFRARRKLAALLGRPEERAQR